MAHEQDRPPYITTSPEGRPCIGMTQEGLSWILLTSKRPPTVAAQVRDQLKENYGLNSIPGPAYSWRQSIKENELVGYPERDVEGIYIPASEFDYYAVILAGSGI